MRSISLKYLEDNGACEVWIKRFKKKFGTKSVRLTRKGLDWIKYGKSYGDEALVFLVHTMGGTKSLSDFWDVFGETWSEKEMPALRDATWKVIRPTPKSKKK